MVGSWFDLVFLWVAVLSINAAGGHFFLPVIKPLVVLQDKRFA
jgi:hypothetical protein